MTTMGGGGHFRGGVKAANADLDENAALGNAVVTYLSCAVLNPSSLAKIHPITVRSWVDLSGITGG